MSEMFTIVQVSCEIRLSDVTYVCVSISNFPETSDTRNKVDCRKNRKLLVSNKLHFVIHRAIDLKVKEKDVKPKRKVETFQANLTRF